MATITPYDFLIKYRSLTVTYSSRWDLVNGNYVWAPQYEPQLVTSGVYMSKYFMMKWDEGSPQLKEYHLVAGGQAKAGKSTESKWKALKANEWYAEHKENIKTAAMGKGSPEDYQLALEWAVRSGKIPNPNTDKLQDYCWKHLGLECSGFVTNYLVAAGKREYSAELLRNTNAASYYDAAQAINDKAAILQGDLLVWMKGAKAKTGPGHIAVVDAPPSSQYPTKMRVCEATGHAHARPKILRSWYDILEVTPKGDKKLGNDVMILKVKRHGSSGDRVCVIRPTKK